MVLWRKRFQREYDEPARYIWKLEFQRRGAPYIHLWMTPPLSPGKSSLPFASWLSETWADIVDHPDNEQKQRHRLAGTAIDILSGLRACDPKRWRSISPSTHPQTVTATRNTSTSCRTPGTAQQGTRPLLGHLRPAQGNRCDRNRPRHLPDGAAHHPPLVTFTSHLRQPRQPLPYRRRPAHRPPHRPTSRPHHRNRHAPPSPTTTPPMRPRRTQRRLRPRQRRTQFRRTTGPCRRLTFLACS
ncbi:Uncharacterised protein [Mycobacteroides abscessus]|nr:Uncharacterised protein [Mycobacteroides abscessus]SKF98350.1 Uncharacterised protein [Mycobacteroides abscessus subsp. massiliense]CPW12810.1 Uncharacterised protein [Mycobacteroides abscessus]CQA07150.1 Uncharacterised protein [Mycobacteroides abscessus]SKG27594.1 Uncharacterised protein [Mycobacteroides abscessus subsp. massiliense]